MLHTDAFSTKQTDVLQKVIIYRLTKDDYK